MSRYKRTKSTSEKLLDIEQTAEIARKEFRAFGDSPKYRECLELIKIRMNQL